MHPFDKWRDIFNLIRLQMTDEMPANILRQCIALFQKFLHAAFSEIAEAKVVLFLNCLDRLCFGNWQQQDIRFPGEL